jgi:hypothetical protein
MKTNQEDMNAYFANRSIQHSGIKVNWITRHSNKRIHQSIIRALRCIRG